MDNAVINAWTTHDEKKLTALAKSRDGNFEAKDPGGYNVFHLFVQGLPETPSSREPGHGRVGSILKGYKAGKGRNESVVRAVNTPDQNEKTPLYVAAEKGNKAAIRALLALGANPKTPCLGKKPEEIAKDEVLEEFPSMEVIKIYKKVQDSWPFWNDKKPFYDKLKELAKRGDVDFGKTNDDEGRNVFHLCVLNNGLTRLQYICEGYVDGGRVNKTIPEAVNALNHLGQTPLYLAADSEVNTKEDPKYIEFLLAMGASPETPCFQQKPEEIAKGRVLEAFSSGEVLRVFNARKGYFADKEACYRKFWSLAKDPKADFAKKDEKGRNIFHLCVEENAENRLYNIFTGYFEGKKGNESIDTAVDATYKVQTPLFMASTKGLRKMCEIFLALGADKKIDCLNKLAEDEYKGEAGKAFHQSDIDCLLEVEFETIIIRLTSGRVLPADIRDGSQNNGILLAIKNGKAKGKSDKEIIEVIEMLLLKGDSLDHTNDRGESPLSLSVAKGYQELTRCLIDQHDPSWIVNQNKDTVVHLAAQGGSGCEEVLELLLKKKPDSANAENASKKTPLHSVQSARAVELLICCGGADPNRQDNQGKVPKDYAPYGSEIWDFLSLYDQNTTDEVKKQICERRASLLWKSINGEYGAKIAAALGSLLLAYIKLQLGLGIV